MVVEAMRWVKKINQALISELKCKNIYASEQLVLDVVGRGRQRSLCDIVTEA